jgi:uncharacterized protein (TIGR02001 family)
MHVKSSKVRALSAALGLAIAGSATPVLAESTLTGNISVVSKYVLRGITNNTESDTAALQGGLDYSHESGFYAGYWGSSLDYGDTTTETGFENDFYGGYSFDAGPVKMSVGAVQYYYMNIDDSNGAEATVRAGYGPFTLGVNYLLTDVIWGNAGDMYWTLNYSKADLPGGFSFGASLGYYVYDDSDKGGNGKIAPGTTTEDGNFRHLNLTVSHPVINDSTSMALTLVLGGKDRSGIDQKEAAVLSLSTGF